jgi:hypothetical protein
MDRIKTAHSIKINPGDAVAEIKMGVGTMDPKMVLFFASSSYEPTAISRAMKDAFPRAVVFGCSTAGEIVTGKMLKESVVAMAFSVEAVADVAIGVMTGIKGNPVNQKIADVFGSFEKHYGTPMADMDFSKYVGLVLVDGLTTAEEKVMDSIGDRTNVLFVGGSAGDDLKFSCTYVYAEGKAYADAAILVLLKPAKEFGIIKTQSFCTSGKRLTATEVNEENREVISFDGKSAASAYAQALNVPADDAANHFMDHPVGLVAGSEIFVRSPQQIKDGKMVFYCHVIKGMELDVLDSTDIIADTKKAVDEKIAELGQPAGLINFNCILRTLELESKGLTEAYGKLFTDVPTVGFSTYGEEFLGHINQTATILLIK